MLSLIYFLFSLSLPWFSVFILYLLTVRIFVVHVPFRFATRYSKVICLPFLRSSPVPLQLIILHFTHFISSSGYPLPLSLPPYILITSLSCVIISYKKVLKAIVLILSLPLCPFPLLLPFSLVTQPFTKSLNKSYFFYVDISIPYPFPLSFCPLSFTHIFFFPRPFSPLLLLL